MPPLGVRFGDWCWPISGFEDGTGKALVSEDAGPPVPLGAPTPRPTPATGRGCVKDDVGVTRVFFEMVEPMLGTVVGVVLMVWVVMLDTDEPPVELNRLTLMFCRSTGNPPTGAGCEWVWDKHAWPAQFQINIIDSYTDSQFRNMQQWQKSQPLKKKKLDWSIHFVLFFLFFFLNIEAWGEGRTCSVCILTGFMTCQDFISYSTNYKLEMSDPKQTTSLKCQMQTNKQNKVYNWHSSQLAENNVQLPQSINQMFKTIMQSLKEKSADLQLSIHSIKITSHKRTPFFELNN